MDDPKFAEHAKNAKDKGLSYYGLRNSGEFVAESVAQYFLSDTSSAVAESVIKILSGG